MRAFGRGRRGLAIVGAILLLAGCASVPSGTYLPSLTDPDALKVSHALYKAAQAAGDDASRYSFALVRSPQAQAWTAEDATFYVTDGLARMPVHIIEPLIAHEVAHELTGDLGRKQALSLSITAGFAIIGVLVPGASLADFVVNPLVVRAYSREHELEAAGRRGPRAPPPPPPPPPRGGAGGPRPRLETTTSPLRGSGADAKEIPAPPR